MTQPRTFTPSEANRTLPLVKRIVADILVSGKALRALDDDDARADDLEQELRGLMRELNQVGCFYKDWNFELGLVDFPAKIDGRDVFLCWRSDEDELTWYHPVEEGFQGRRPIPDELLADSVAD